MVLYGGGDSLWDIVWSAEWAATVGLPLAVTVGSLVVAYTFVRRQLRHDRDLAVAQRRADAAGRLGTTMIEFQRQFDAMPSEDPWWTEPLWPQFGALLRAVDEAEVVFDEESAFEYVKEVGRCIQGGWLACRVRCDEMAAAREAPSTLHYAYALAETIEPHTSRLFAAGKQLIRWDGYGKVSVAALELFERVPEEPAAWSAAVADEFAARAKVHGSGTVSVRLRRRR